LPRPANDPEHVVEEVDPEVEIVQTGVPPFLKCGDAAVAVGAVMSSAIDNAAKNTRILRMANLPLFGFRGR
jgi:hypothetical protein